MTTDGPVDLRAFFKAVGAFAPIRADINTAPPRPEPDDPAELLDDDISEVTAAPLTVDGFVDGIQASIIVTHVQHRPVHLSYVSAGAVGAGATPLAIRERLAVVASSDDIDWVNEVRGMIDTEIVEESDPPAVAAAAAGWVASCREQLERHVVEDLTERDAVDCLVVDGSLVGRPVTPALVGVVKTTRRRYLADESCLYRLPARWRSPRFRLTGGDGGTERYSCYLRLWDATHSGWDHALIRLEAFDPDQLDPLAALCIAERQRAAGGDKRWDRHLASMRTCEEFLRSRRPAVFNMAG